MKKFLYLLITLSLIVFGCAKANDPYQEEHKMKIVTSYSTIGNPLHMDSSGELIFIAEDFGGFRIINKNTNNVVFYAKEVVQSLVPKYFQAKAINYNAETKVIVLTNRLQGTAGANWQMEFYDYSDQDTISYIDMSSGDTIGILPVLWNNPSDPRYDFEIYRITRSSLRVARSYVTLSSLPVNRDSMYYSVYPDTPQKFSIDENYVTIANGQTGVTIFNRLSGTKITSFDTPGFANQAVKKDNYVYVADKHLGLQVYKLDSSMNATNIYSYDTTGYADNIDVKGNLLAISSTSGGVYLFDISNPDNTKLVDRLSLSKVGYVNNVHFSKDGNEKVLYVLSRDKGVLKVKID